MRALEVCWLYHILITAATLTCVIGTKALGSYSQLVNQSGLQSTDSSEDTANIEESPRNYGPVKVWPAPPDPFPDWDPDKPVNWTIPKSSCRITLQNSRFIGGALDGEVIARMFANLERCATTTADRLPGLNVSEYATPTTLNSIALVTERPDYDAVGGVGDIEESRRPIMAGHWVLQPDNAYLAFRSIVIHNAAFKKTLTKSALLTFQPTPTASLEKRAPSHVAIRAPSGRTSHDYKSFTVCSEEKFLELLDEEECFPVYADITSPRTREKLWNWMARFGWEGREEDITVQTPVTEEDALRNLQYLGLPFLRSLSAQYRKDPGKPSGIRCPGEEQNLSHFQFNFCFSSGPIPDSASTCVDIVRVTYGWQHDAVSPEEQLRIAMAMIDPEFATCQIDNDIPEFVTQPPRILQAVDADSGRYSRGPCCDEPFPGDVPSRPGDVPSRPGDAPAGQSLATKDGQIPQPLVQRPADGPANQMQLTSVIIGNQVLEATLVKGIQPYIIYGSQTIAISQAITTSHDGPISFNINAIGIGTSSIPVTGTITDLPSTTSRIAESQTIQGNNESGRKKAQHGSGNLSLGFIQATTSASMCQSSRPTGSVSFLAKEGEAQSLRIGLWFFPLLMFWVVIV